MKFSFSIKNTKDGILYTEGRLRDLIDAILRRKYGQTWEDDPNITGWSKDKKASLEHSYNENKNEFPYEAHSTRFLDYTYILDLKKIVLKNDSLFRSIFLPWNHMIAMFDTLGMFRDRIMHPGNQIMKHQHYLCLGACGQFLLAIEHWEKGYSRAIQSYSCDFRFDELEQEDLEGAKSRSVQKVNEWLKSIKDMSRRSEIEQDKYGQLHKICLTKGEVKISFPQISRQSYSTGYTQSTNVHLSSKSVNAIGDVLADGGHPCWTFNWTLSNELDISSMVSALEETNRKPLSSSNNETGITGTSYTIGTYNGNIIRVDISAGASGTTEITLVHDSDVPNSGFTNVHKVFSPDIILQMVYKEIPRNKINELIKEACQ